MELEVTGEAADGELPSTDGRIEALDFRLGEDPIEEKGAVSTGLFDGGGSQVVDLELPKGNVALLCFVSDREGGPPHVAKRMVSTATVE